MPGHNELSKSSWIREVGMVKILSQTPRAVMKRALGKRS